MKFCRTDFFIKIQAEGLPYPVGKFYRRVHSLVMYLKPAKQKVCIPFWIPRVMRPGKQ